VSNLFAGRGGPFLRKRRASRGSTTLDLTPLIDVVFQLLIFFVLTNTFQDTAALQVDLAEAKNRERSAKDEAVVLSIGQDGSFELDHTVVDAAELELRLCRWATEGRTSVHIRADKESQHAALVTAMDLAKQCGFKKLGILHQN
jgi:biopolymer transport protein ExbD